MYNENNGDLKVIGLYIGEGDEIFNRKLNLKKKDPLLFLAKMWGSDIWPPNYFILDTKNWCKLVEPVNDIDRILFISFWSGQADGVVGEGEWFASVWIAALISLSSPHEGGGDHCMLWSWVPALGVSSKQLLNQVTPFSVPSSPHL